MNIIYFGTPDFSAHVLERIITEMKDVLNINLVVTQPDKPVGRKQILTPSPVKLMAQKYKIPIIDTIDSLLHGSIANNKLDLALVYAYGEILPKEVLNIPKYGFWNIHPSLLPKYRGPAPIAYPLILGDSGTGVTLMQMDEFMDHGPLLAQEQYQIQVGERRENLEKKLSDLGFTMFQNIIVETSRLNVSTHGRGEGSPLFLSTTPPPVPQKHDGATYTKILHKDDGFIPFNLLAKALQNQPIIYAEFPQIIKTYYKSPKNKFEIQNIHDTHSSAQIIYDLFRGLHPWPGIWTTLPDLNKRLKLIDLDLQEGNLIIKQVQLEGKNIVDFPTFTSAYKIFKV
jgi:methionyl-tRNA formyltransferase